MKPIESRNKKTMRDDNINQLMTRAMKSRIATL